MTPGTALSGVEEQLQEKSIQGKQSHLHCIHHSETRPQETLGQQSVQVSSL